MLVLSDTLDEELLWDPDRFSGGWIVAKSADFAEWKAAFAELGGDSIAFNFIALIIAPDSSKY